MANRDGRYHVIDLRHQGRPDSIAACVMRTGEGPILVDPGPSSTLPALRSGLEGLGLRESDLAAVLLTHIHLDHAGASGTLARANPRLRVYVHARGAPHLIDPTKLVGSATRLYGERMEELWGEIAPVSESQIVVLDGGEILRFGERRIEVAWTPGHAWHHVCYFDSGAGTAYVGDTAGIAGPRLPVVLPVTPPPDFQLEEWLGSIDRILAWNPRELVLTHFGGSGDPHQHLAALAQGLKEWCGFVEGTLALDGTDSERIGMFVEMLRVWIRGKAPAELAEQYLSGAGPEACWQGIARYYRVQGSEFRVQG
jgi:glyoxylase-like metal-dependent hydrolase (beta-lactamase superfamily II)